MSVAYGVGPGSEVSTTGYRLVVLTSLRTSRHSSVHEFTVLRFTIPYRPTAFRMRAR